MIAPPCTHTWEACLRQMRYICMPPSPAPLIRRTPRCRGHAWRRSQHNCSHDPTLSPTSIPTRDPKVFYNDAHHPGGLTGARAMGDMAAALILNAAIGLVEEPFSAADASGLEVGSTRQSRPTY